MIKRLIDILRRADALINWVALGSDNGNSPTRCQVFTWINYDYLTSTLANKLGFIWFIINAFWNVACKLLVILLRRQIGKDAQLWSALLKLMTPQFKYIVTHMQETEDSKMHILGVENFVWNFKGAIRNFAHNFKHINGKICILRVLKEIILIASLIIQGIIKEIITKLVTP